MNWDQVEGKWKEYKGKVQQRWGQLTDDDLDVVEGKREELVGRLQQRYGMAKEAAEREVQDFVSTLKEEDWKEEDTAAQRRSHNAGRGSF